MMYTVKELESIVSDGSNAVDITDIVDQLLDALKRIDAAAGIEAHSLLLPDDSNEVDAARELGEVVGWNRARLEFRAALELGGE